MERKVSGLEGRARSKYTAVDHTNYLKFCQKAEGKISFTADIWTDDNSKNLYLVITAHWIALEDRTAMLGLKAGLIAFHYLPGSHTGTVLSSEILGLLNRAKVANNVSIWFYHVACSDLL